MSTNELFDLLRQTLLIAPDELKMEALHVLHNFVMSAQCDLVEDVLRRHLKVLAA